jgi:ACS family glucarate transporter-like MFS transporter
MTPTETPTSDPAAAPTRYRYVVLGLLCLLAMITYMDRAASSSAKPAIMHDLGVNADQFFIVLMAFQLAYALFEVPSGFLGDTFGPRSILIRVVVWWTAFVALTTLAGVTLPGGIYVGFTALIAIQFFFGVGEAGAFPNMSKAIYNWFPDDQRGTAKSIIWMSARFMGGLTPLLWVLLVDLGGLTWRQAMLLFAAVAACWVVAFIAIFRNTPSEVRHVNDAELARIYAGRRKTQVKNVVPWGKLLMSRNLWALCGMYVVTNFCWYFLMYDLPTRMKSQFIELNADAWGKVQLALLAGAPLLVGMFGCLAGGFFSDWYIRKTGSLKWGRRVPGMVGYGVAGVCYLAAAAAHVNAPDNVWLFAGLLIAMGFFNDLIMAPAWASAQDIGREYAATVSGAMNMFGNLVGAVSGIFFTGKIQQMFPDDGKGGPDAIVILFSVYAAVYFVGVGLWAMIDVTKSIDPSQAVPIDGPKTPAG